MKVLALILLQVSLALCNVRFDNYTLYQIVPQTEEQLDILKDLQLDDDLDFWNDPTYIGNYVDILVAPDQKSKLKALFDARSSVEVLTDDVQQWIDNEKIETQSVGGMTFTAYHTLNSIYSWLDALVAANSGIVTKIIGGQTWEGRRIEGIRISHGSGRRIIFIEGGIHSREWVSPSTVNFIINELLYSTNPEIREIARSYEWHIFPVTNPDGYVRTFANSRMWRKNVRPVSNQWGSGTGVDLNRNWDSHWMVAGSSDRPTSDTFAGTAPFSEIETRTLSNYIRSIGSRIEMYLSFHAFSQMLLLPYGHTRAHLDNYNDVVTIGRRAMTALAARYNTRYVTGNIAEVIYLASGGSVDWVKQALRVPIVLCYELRDTGRFGFMLPADQIRPTGEETMDSVLALIREGKRFGYFP